MLLTVTNRETCRNCCPSLAEAHAAVRRGVTRQSSEIGDGPKPTSRNHASPRRLTQPRPVKGTERCILDFQSTPTLFGIVWHKHSRRWTKLWSLPICTAQTFYLTSTSMSQLSSMLCSMLAPMPSFSAWCVASTWPWWEWCLRVGIIRRFLSRCKTDHALRSPHARQVVRLESASRTFESLLGSTKRATLLFGYATLISSLVRLWWYVSCGAWCRLEMRETEFAFPLHTFPSQTFDCLDTPNLDPSASTL